MDINDLCFAQTLATRSQGDHWSHDSYKACASERQSRMCLLDLLAACESFVKGTERGCELFSCSDIKPYVTHEVTTFSRDGKKAFDTKQNVSCDCKTLFLYVDTNSSLVTSTSLT